MLAYLTVIAFACGFWALFATTNGNDRLSIFAWVLFGSLAIGAIGLVYSLATGQGGL